MRASAPFRLVRTQPSVLFFDEFDAIGKERGDTHETGEIKRVVSFLLMQLDQVPSYVIVVAASNHGELLDRAVWRRFQLRLAFPAPKRRDVKCSSIRVCLLGQTPRTAFTGCRRLGPISYAEALDFCQNVRRRKYWALGKYRSMTHWIRNLNFGRRGFGPRRIHAERSDQTAPAADAARRARSPGRKAKGRPST